MEKLTIHQEYDVDGQVYFSVRRGSRYITSTQTRSGAEKLLKVMEDEYVGSVAFLDAYKEKRLGYSDGVARSVEFVKSFAEHNGKQAAEIAKDLENNITAAVEVSGLPPSAIHRIIKMLKGD